MAKRTTTKGPDKAQASMDSAALARAPVLFLPPGTKMEFHPFSMEFPMMGEEEKATLKEDIKEHGQLVPILVYEKQVLEGRNRFEVNTALKRGTKYEEFVGTEQEAKDLVFSSNYSRRNLTPGQKAMIAAKKVTTKKGDNRFSIIGMTQAKASQKYKIGVDSIKKATRLIKDAPPEILEAVWTGKMDLDPAIKKAFPEAIEAVSVVQESVPSVVVEATIGGHTLIALPPSPTSEEVIEPLIFSPSGRAELIAAVDAQKALDARAGMELKRALLRALGASEGGRYAVPARQAER